MKSFVDTVKAYSAWKLQEKGNAKLTKKEVSALREEYRNAQNSRSETAGSLREAVQEYRNWKKTTKGDGSLTQKEFNLLKESIQGGQSKLVENNWNQYVLSYKRFKESKVPNAKLTYKELKLLKENFKEANARGISLREADAGMNPQMGAPMAGDPNAMPADPNGAMPGAPGAGAVDPTLAAQIQDVVQSANALAASAGIQTTSLGADPLAGQPPVDGTMPPADPNAMGGALPEAIAQYRAWKKATKGTDKLTEKEVNILAKRFGNGKQKSEYETIQERIAARQAKLKAIQENSAQDYAKSQLGAMGVGIPVSNSHAAPQGASSEELVKVPAEGTLANGYSSGAASKETSPAKTWPTRATSTSATGGALQGAGATQSKMKETVTDAYVDKYFEPKLDFDQIRESMKNGLLG